MSRACDRSVLMPGVTAANLPMCHLGEKQLKEALLPSDASKQQVDAFVRRMLDIGVTWHKGIDIGFVFTINVNLVHCIKFC